MEPQVRLVYPKDKPLKEWLRARLPRAYEAVVALNTRLKDRRYRRLQEDLFGHLAGMSEQPFHVEIETLNKCNSTCAFCPVNRDSDPRPTMRMDEALFRRIIDELADWDYRNVVNLFSNNEPFLDKRIFEFTEYARERLPHAFIQIISNGTALNVENTERILPHLSRLIVNNYSTRLVLHDNVQAIVDHLNAHRPDLAGKMVVGFRLLDEVKTNRAGNAPNRTVSETVYTSRCAYPFFQMVIRPDGKVSLCCNDALGEVTLGDAGTGALRAAWNSPERRQVQRAMLAGRDGIDLCRTCDNLSWAKPRRIAEAVAARSFTA
ncbi:MAG: SPASM domain-containing protein [Hyphomicrobiales bacterium]|nr:SPASM domain-containing protein [Hyphomicrobiales bacterium]